MLVDRMTYKMQPAGHEEPERKREYQKPDKSLCEAFESWASRHDSWAWGQSYHDAKLLLKELKPSVEEVQALLLAYQDHPRIKAAGLFISAAYNIAEQKEIVHDVKIPLDWIGYSLFEGKILVNFSALPSLGEKNYGTIINYGKVQGSFGDGSFRNFSINYGSCQQFDGYCTASVHINLGNVYFTPHGIGNTNCLLINLGAWGQSQHNCVLNGAGERFIPSLQKYLEDLKNTLEPGRPDYRKAIEAVKKFGDEPAQKIKQDIEGLLKEAGGNV